MKTSSKSVDSLSDVRTGIRCSRLAVVCVGLLCGLLLTTNIVLYMNCECFSLKHKYLNTDIQNTYVLI